MAACNDISSELSAYLDGELTASERQTVDTHLRECDACRSELTALSSVASALSEMPALAAPQGFGAAVRAQINSSTQTKAPLEVDFRPAPLQPKAGWNPIVFSFVALLVVSVLVYLALPSMMSSLSETQTAQAPDAKSAPPSPVIALPAPAEKAMSKDKGVADEKEEALERVQKDDRGTEGGLLELKENKNRELPADKALKPKLSAPAKPGAVSAPKEEAAAPRASAFPKPAPVIAAGEERAKDGFGGKAPEPEKRADSKKQSIGEANPLGDDPRQPAPKVLQQNGLAGDKISNAAPAQKSGALRERDAVEKLEKSKADNALDQEQPQHREVADRKSIGAPARDGAKAAPVPQERTASVPPAVTVSPSAAAPTATDKNIEKTRGFSGGAGPGKATPGAPAASVATTPASAPAAPAPARAAKSVSLAEAESENDTKRARRALSKAQAGEALPEEMRFEARDPQTLALEIQKLATQSGARWVDADAPSGRQNTPADGAAAELQFVILASADRRDALVAQLQQLQTPMKKKSVDATIADGKPALKAVEAQTKAAAKKAEEPAAGAVETRRLADVQANEIRIPIRIVRVAE